MRYCPEGPAWAASIWRLGLAFNGVVQMKNPFVFFLAIFGIWILIDKYQKIDEMRLAILQSHMQSQPSNDLIIFLLFTLVLVNSGILVYVVHRLTREPKPPKLPEWKVLQSIETAPTQVRQFALMHKGYPVVNTIDGTWEVVDNKGRVIGEEQRNV